ncbi:facilitated trehalose transporter Tret1-like [Onthophagus taurus]|uniref:facilitated trehalose transporter Tret1-like n=1 Tax=Onthophagus taurus TaxID=166361 RepID=UPI000C206E85|nr:facilitated trehalose transporter Tret1-like [Onthophagus taurus]
MNNVSTKPGCRFMQYAAATSAALSSAASSAYGVWTSPALPILQSEASPIGRSISDEEASWLVSSFLLTSIIGIGLSGWLIERIGRKPPLIIASVLQFLPWIAIILVTSFEGIMIARVIGGIGCGISIVACAVYNTEIADRDNRGKLGTFFMALKLTGSLIVLGIGPYVSYTTLGIICAIFPILSIISLIFIPESPYYLTKVGNFDGARKSVISFAESNSKEENINVTLAELKNSVQSDMMDKTSIWEFLSQKKYRRALIVMACVKTLQQFSGFAAIEAYMQTIISKTDSVISPEQSSTIFGVVQVLGVFAASFMVDKLGRKPLLVVSAVGCGLSLCGEGVYFYIQNETVYGTNGIKWMPTTGIALFMIMSAIGIISIPYVLLGELFPANIKGIAVSITTMYGTVLAFAVSKSFDPISRALGIHSMFWLYSANCLVGAVFVLFLLPETKGETFADIQDKVNSKGQKGIYYFVV